MFRANDEHRQMQMFTTVDGLPAQERALLEQSWAATFYREVFCRLDERPFAVLYAEEPSRPNIPVNVLLALELLKGGSGWSDEELISNFYFNVQVRYALGLSNLGDEHFDLRTVYNFRHRLSQHMQATGENLIAQAFEPVTDEQLAAWPITTGRVRMDSMIVGKLENERPVAPGPPWNKVSPVKTVFSEARYRLTAPGEWPGVCRTSISLPATGIRSRSCSGS